jgi:DNA-binding beta-propeller fold protein YncE
MRNWSRWLSATAMTAALVAATALPATAEPPQRTVSLPLTSFTDIAVDPSLGHVFVSSRVDHAVAITDLSGNVITKLTNLPGAAGLALSPDGDTVFVALSQYGAIAALDTLTLTERARYPVGEVCPSDLAITNNRLYFSYGCREFEGGIGRVGFNGAEARTGLQTGHYSPQQLASTPAKPGLLAAGQPGLSPAALQVLREEGDTLAVQASTRDAGSNLADVEFSKDGTQVHVAAGAPYYIQSYTSESLAVRGSYHTGPYPVAVSTSPDTGALAAGINDNTAVRLYPPGSFTESRSYEVPDLHTASLAWGPGARWVYAVSNRFGQPAKLHVLKA